MLELGNFATFLPGLRQIGGLSFHGIKNCHSDKNEISKIKIFS